MAQVRAASYPNSAAYRVGIWPDQGREFPSSRPAPVESTLSTSSRTIRSACLASSGGNAWVGSHVLGLVGAGGCSLSPFEFVAISVVSVIAILIVRAMRQR